MAKKKCSHTHIGGQAVIEGVMMKNKDKIATAIRKKGKIIVKKEKIRSLTEKKLFKLPFIRGFIQLLEMMILGMKKLTWSANQQQDEGEEMTKKEIFISIFIAVIATILLFIILPYYLTKLVSDTEGIFFNLIDGLLRVMIFLLYVLAISFMNDVKRLFQYHGAEHKAVACYEAGKPLTPNNCKKYSRLHPRCGSSFIIIVLTISIIVFSLIVSDSNTIKILARVILIPVIAGISYEILKISAKFERFLFFKMIIAPGLWLQKMTTKEPTKKQLEVAIKALKSVI